MFGTEINGNGSVVDCSSFHRRRSKVKVRITLFVPFKKNVRWQPYSHIYIFSSTKCFSTVKALLKYRHRLITGLKRSLNKNVCERIGAENLFFPTSEKERCKLNHFLKINCNLSSCKT